MLEHKIDQIIRDALRHEGYDVVCVRVTGQKRLTVQVFIDRQDQQPVSLDDCAKASPMISALLDVKDPIENPYVLEVSSPGLERPLWRLEDYPKFCGQKIHCYISHAIQGQKRFNGVLTQADDQGITLNITPEGPEASLVPIPYADIKKAHLIF